MKQKRVLIGFLLKIRIEIFGSGDEDFKYKHRAQFLV